MQGTRSK